MKQSVKNILNKSALVVATAAMIAGLLTTTGCQTTKGFGKDIEYVGEKIQGE